MVLVQGGSYYTPDSSQSQDIWLLHKLAQTSGSGDEDITSSSQFIALICFAMATVDDTRQKFATVAEFQCLLVYLNNKLTSWRDNEHQRLGTDTV
jgi:hypothetical protein